MMMMIFDVAVFVRLFELCLHVDVAANLSKKKNLTDLVTELLNVLVFSVNCTETTGQLNSFARNLVQQSARCACMAG